MTGWADGRGCRVGSRDPLLQAIVPP
eukprot:COSAG06_NODE_32522_length_504_cov_1.520988_1_plen_25_part_01